MLGGDSGLPDVDAVEALCRSITCPAVVVHGTLDAVIPVARGERVAELTGAELVRFEGSGHAPHVRDPVKVNLLLRDFAERVTAAPPPATTWQRGVARPEARAVRVVADRPRARLARRRDRRRAAPAGARPRDRLARTGAGHDRAAAARRNDPSRQRGARQRGRAHRPRGGRARPPRLPSPAADGRDLLRELHGLPRPRPRRAIRRLDRRRRLGDRLLPTREPRAEDDARTPG